MESEEETTDTEESESSVDKLLRDIFGDDDVNERINSEEENTEGENDTDESMWHKVKEDDEEIHLLNDRRFIVGERELLYLIERTTCSECGERIDSSTIQEGEKVAAGVKYQYLCINAHKNKWISTPFYGGKSLVALLIQLMVLLSGASWSKFAAGAKFINLVTGCSRAFYHHQLLYKFVLLESDRFKHIRHSLDIWHKAKKLAYMLGDAAKKAAHRSLLPWIRPTVNHFWYCCNTCSGDVQKLIKKWFKILHHVTNEHEWSGGRCNHSKDTNAGVEKWISKDSSTYREFRKIVVNKEFTGNFQYYTTCKQTWAIENLYFHTLLHYCQKQVSFGFDSCVMRNQLAVIDYNHHLDREIQQARDGTSVPFVQFSRKTKQLVAYDRRVAKSYTYIPDLIATCIRQTYGARREAYTKSAQAKKLDGIATNLSGDITPSSKELLNSRKKRKTCGLDLSASC
ncbi:uncharacterized protein LOC134282303 [Saccostrea cucullata]|uniref:uncharacterized protein LOC134282303 n=1 Tax=Saccostrea cuccullata TaxID=36930 RepID=UPI002ED06BE8